MFTTYATSLFIVFAAFFCRSAGYAENFLGCSQPLFDEQIQPQPLLLDLLTLVGMNSSESASPSLATINDWAQRNLLRRGERWDSQTTRFEELKPTIYPLLTELGFTEAVTPHFRDYDGAIVHGALLSTVRTRLSFLVQCWKEGARFSDLYFFSGERPLEPAREEREALIQDEGSSLKIRSDWHAPTELPQTEAEMMRFVWEQADLPEEMRASVTIHVVNAPMKRDPETGLLIRPTTQETVEEWLKGNPFPGRYLAVSNAPYIQRQGLIAKALSPSQYAFDSVGPRASERQPTAIFLDELARCLFFLEATNFFHRREDAKAL